ncbi:MAG TPA: hypothetical protein VFS83_11785, partial [Ktedonobacterales bacterium]|nr:hypothetical protein [Ktedonobacterales bacterium]
WLTAARNSGPRHNRQSSDHMGPLVLFMGDGWPHVEQTVHRISGGDTSFVSVFVTSLPAETGSFQGSNPTP